MLVLHCVLVVIAPVPWPYVYMQLVGPPQTPDFHNLPSDFTQQISLVIFSIFSLPIKQIVSPNLPLQAAWCVVLVLCFVCSLPSHCSQPQPREGIARRQRTVIFQFWWRLPGLQFCSVFHSPVVSVHITKTCLLHCTPGSADRFVGRGSTPCRAVSWGKPTGHIYQEQILKHCSLENQVSAEYKCALLVL